MQPEQKLSQAVQVAGGKCHLDFSAATFGKVAIFFDLTSRKLHLVGDMTQKNLTKYFPNIPAADARDRDVLRAVCVGVRAMDNDNFGPRHKYIRAPSDVTNGCIIGGAAAYFDGAKLFVNDLSARFGSITLVALRMCMEETKIQIVAGFYLEGGENVFAKKGLEEVQYRLRG